MDKRKFLYYNLYNIEKNKNWDSLKHMQIIVNIERKFNVKIKTSDVGRLNTFNKLKDYIIK